MIPRNLFPGLELPLVFALFTKGRLRKLFGFALYHETADVNSMKKEYRAEMSAGGGSIWMNVVEKSLKTEFWKENIRQTLRRHADRFVPVGNGCYQLA